MTNRPRPAEQDSVHAVDHAARTASELAADVREHDQSMRLVGRLRDILSKFPTS